MARCQRCGERLGRSASFCGTCGAPSDVDLVVEPVDEVSKPVGSLVDLGGRRRRDLVVLGVVAGVVLVALAVARGSSSNGSRSESAPTTSVARPTTSAQPVDGQQPGFHAPEGFAAPAVSTTTGTEVLGPLLPDPSGLQLLTVETSGRVRLIDLDTGTAVTRPFSVEPSNQFSSVFAIGDALVISGYDGAGVPATSVYRAGFDIPMGLVGGRSWPIPGTDEFFSVTSFYPDGKPMVLYRYDQFGSEVAASIQLPEGVTDAFPLGDGVLLSAGPGLYRLDPTTSEITFIVAGYPEGEVRSNSSTFDVFTCDEKLQCAISTFDTSGKLVGTAPAGDRFGGRQRWASPDGSQSLVMTYRPTGTEVEVVARDETVLWTYPNPNSIDGQAVGWSPNSQWLFLKGESGLMAWREGLTEPVVLGLSNVVAFSLVAS